MTTASENEFLARIGPARRWARCCGNIGAGLPLVGTGRRRRPAAPHAAWREADRLRDSAAIGVFDHRCPHRCAASLFFGRNEEGGLRCAYHGWKFDTQGNYLDMPNVAGDHEVAQVKARAHRAAERNGACSMLHSGRARGGAALALDRGPAVAAGGDRRSSAGQRELQLVAGFGSHDVDTAHFNLPPRRVIFGRIPARSIANHMGALSKLIGKSGRGATKRALGTDWGTMYTVLSIGRRSRGTHHRHAAHSRDAVLDAVPGTGRSPATSLAGGWDPDGRHPHDAGKPP